MLSSKLQELAEDGTWQVISAPQSILNFSQPLQVKSVCFHFLKVLIWALRLQLGKVPIKKKKKSPFLQSIQSIFCIHYLNLHENENHVILGFIILWKGKSLSRVGLFAAVWTVGSVHGILQARIVDWAATHFSRGSSQPRGWTQVSPIAGRLFTIWATREASIIL